jgi:hypothetical protein
MTLKGALNRAILWFLPAGATAYADDLLTRFRIEREALRPRKAPPELLARYVRETGARHVVDFGGGAGEIARDLVAVLPDVRVTIVENESMARHGRPSPGVAFATEIPASDLFFTSGALFYVPDPMTRLEQGLRASRCAILLRNYFGEPKTIIQHSWLYDNGDGPIPPGFRNGAVSYSRSTLNEDAVIALAMECGYGKPIASAGQYSRDLVFVREHS